MEKMDRNFFGNNIGSKGSVKTGKKEKFTEQDLEHDFEEYSSRGCKGEKDKGRAYAKFSTSVILHSVFGKRVSRTYDFTPEGSGDCYFDGLCIAINQKPVTDYREVLDFEGKISSVDFYFIQSKMHKKMSVRKFLFDKDEFESFVNAVTRFLNDGTLYDKNPNELILRDRKIYTTIKTAIKRRPTKVNVHFYFASFCNKENHDPYQVEEASVRKNYRANGISDVTFVWADRDFLCSNYRAYSKARSEAMRKVPDQKNKPAAGSGVKTKPAYAEKDNNKGSRCTGKIWKLFFNKNGMTGGIIVNDRKELVLFGKENITGKKLKLNSRVSYQYEKNNGINKGCMWHVSGNSLKVCKGA